MTALHAAGGGLPLALQIPNVVEQIGSIAGFAAVVGLAVLSALYFSQARDLRRLREWAGRAPERAAEGAPVAPSPAPGRVVAVPQQRPPQAGTPAPAAAGAPAGATTTAATAAGATTTAATAAGATTPAATGATTVQASAANGDGAPAVQKPAGDAEEPGQLATAGQPERAADADGVEKPAGGADANPDGSKPHGDADPAKPAGPSMPAPASAAAASAGSAPKTVAAPAAQPQRPPGSVLPPRTGTLPPVRRLPSSNVGRTGGPSQTGVLGPAGQPPKKKRSPLKIVLAVVGVLVLGGAAAVGVPAIVNGSKNDDNSAAKSGTTKKASTSSAKATPAKPGSITVAVLNGTSIPGLAAQIGDRVEAEGFVKGTVSNAALTSGERANSVVMYARGNESDARLVARKLSIRNVTPIDANSQSIAGDATVVVLVGTDKTQ